MSTANEGLEYKASSVTPDVGLLDADDATGVVEAIVSVTGVTDHDNDIIEPGAYAKTLKVRTPKGIFHHDWHKWASKTLQIEEWMPGDSRLPATMKDGQPWPEGAGVLFVRTQYNLKTTQGRDAYENVKFYGPECEWSVGYRVPPGKSVRGKDGVRRIKEIDLFEYSPVLFGANSMSATLAVKEAATTAEQGTEGEAEGDGGQAWTDLDAEADTVADGDLEEPPAPVQEEQQPDVAEDDAPEDDEEAAQEEEASQDAPDGEESDGGDAEGKGSQASLNRSPRKNWVENAGELPGYIREIARSISEKRGVPLERAIPIAIATVKKWARGGDNVTAETRTKAAKAVAEWEKLKARNAARKKVADVESDVKTAERPSLPEEIESTLFPHLPGTYEELRAQIQAEAAKAFARSFAEANVALSHVEVMGTWPDHAVVTAYGDGKATTYEVPYSVTVGDEATPETVTLAEPEPVELRVTVDGAEEDGEKMLPFPSQIEDVTTGLKAWLTHAPESKAGRVLSAANERRLLGAVESLVAVLKAAGLEVGVPKRNEEDEETEAAASDVVTMSDSTAPSARPDGKAALDPSLLARGYRIAAEAASRRW